MFQVRRFPTLAYMVPVAAFALGGCAPESPQEPWESASEDEGALRVCSEGSTTEGVDVSYYQGQIDWATVATTSVKFAVVRVSDGLSFKDPRFAENWAGAKSAGIVRGAYQFFRPAQDPVQQADLLVDAIASDPIGAGDLPAVLDIEVTGGVSKATLRARMHTWLDRVEAKTGKRPIIYTAAFMQDTVGTGFSDYNLWVANYTSQCPLIPTGWNGWNMWQYTEAGTVAGIPGKIDRDKFNGSIDELLAFAGGTSTPDPTQPDPDPQPDPPQNPDAPGGLSPADGSSVGGSSVTLQCDDFASASGYEFEIQYYKPSSHSWIAYYTYSTSKSEKTFWPVLEAAFRFRARASTSNGDTPSSEWSTFSFGGAPLP